MTNLNRPQIVKGKLTAKDLDEFEAAMAQDDFNSAGHAVVMWICAGVLFAFVFLTFNGSL